ncbi:MAG: sigma-70 family RNA polymerase sigma factor [Flavobacteriales bacterium]|nr:sigma-70 family RNA polymerase sigma factor [Flavobacteriia bacterium]NCP05435.1 sigma-70 family RNA polymerase sigma factor [Flavobacteriales bacterium]PIV94785.1 MAG: RNA polymerase subunit sigma-70 [Flavobacteriaceae bacterium CG17_big_fil_post_rev_8_21_14_2_50_33_15]PIY12250.1 MAG: RNA polymerase subunit sigma-70 [Flavobacteriaceae bacterium CG_4_10_14_3_um_filter_33_47]PJB16497.1 MAG: RNA polymerase subunit sigma-70 [Flavobacteriaceae bacterium CG_4_9_14_3_um_filter_33_16]
MPKNLLNPNKWIDLYADYLFNYTISRVNDREIAQDLVQDTFLAALKSMKNFKGEANERTWLISILKRKIIDYYRKINSNKGKAEIRITSNNDSETDGDWLEERVADPFDKTAEDTMQNTELGEAIFNCLAKLPEKQAEVFRMKTIEGIETEDICNELNITASNLWVIIHRARTAMSSCLKENWF